MGRGAGGTSVLVSVLLRPPPERRAAELTLVAGVATAVVVERATGLAAQIKWPNDVMLDRRKVPGGIAELTDGAVVLGIGLNVNQTPEQLPAETKVAGRLAALDHGVERDREPILADLLLELDARYDAWRDGGLDALYDDLGARDFLRGRRVSGRRRRGHGADDRRATAGSPSTTASGPLLVESGEVLYVRALSSSARRVDVREQAAGRPRRRAD